MHLYYFILSVVYFYSERPPLSKYFILCVVYFYSERPPLLQRSVAREFGGVSQIFFFFRKKLYFRKLCFGLPQESPWLRSLYCNDTWTLRYYSISILSILKLFVTLGVQTSWSTCGEWIGNFGFYTTVCDKQRLMFCC